MRAQSDLDENGERHIYDDESCRREVSKGFEAVKQGISDERKKGSVQKSED